MKLIPYQFYPTTVAIVDDDEELLLALTLALVSQVKCQPFSSAIEAKKSLVNYYKAQLEKQQNPLALSYTNPSVSLSVDIDISMIRQILFNRQRFEQIHVVVVDYDIPEMNGLELARYLKSQTELKIIMLTGAADQETAIKAFNDKEIDRFIFKNAPDYKERLLKYIAELQLEYFVDMTRGLLDSLATTEGHPLQNLEFIKLFEKVCLDNNIVEYYLLDESGSFVMCDATGKPTWLIVRTEEDMEMFYELANDEGDAPKKLVESLKNREVIALFPDEGSINFPAEKWHFEKALLVKGAEIYYCILKENPSVDMDFKKICSYEQFLKSR